MHLQSVLVFNQLRYIVEVHSDDVTLQDPFTIFYKFFFSITHLPHLHYAWKVDLALNTLRTGDADLRF